MYACMNAWVYANVHKHPHKCYLFPNKTRLSTQTNKSIPSPTLTCAPLSRHTLTRLLRLTHPATHLRTLAHTRMLTQPDIHENTQALTHPASHPHTPGCSQNQTPTHIYPGTHTPSYTPTHTCTHPDAHTTRHPPTHPHTHPATHPCTNTQVLTHPDTHEHTLSNIRACQDARESSSIFDASG